MSYQWQFQNRFHGVTPGGATTATRSRKRFVGPTPAASEEMTEPI